MKRGQRPKKQLILVLVEGPSDRDVLETGISKLYERIDPTINVVFPPKKYKDQENGDITSEYGNNPENIEKRVVSNFIDPYLKDFGLYPKDISEIIQITDTDGVYISDDHIFLNSDLERIEYKPEGMYTNNITKTAERNQIKRANLNRLMSLYTIKVGSKTIPYSIYYFSTNLEHVLYNEQNTPRVWKTTLAKEYKKKCDSDKNYFQNTFLLSEDCKSNLSYEDSWEFIKEGTNSLQPHSNLYLLIKSLITNGEENNSLDVV